MREMLDMIEAPSPNHEPRAPGARVDILLLHYTGMETGEAALTRLRDPATKVSAHYMIEEDGRIFRLVPEDRRAWHAGAACWDGESDVNSRSIGIELVNPGHEFGYRAFPEAQIASLLALGRDIVARHPIPPHRVLGHSDVAPARKQDPGELFPWKRLAEAGIGVWPEPAQEPADVPSILWFQEQLAAFGYCVPHLGELDAETCAVLAAFQRRFRPSAVTGAPDAETAARVEAVAATLRRTKES